MEEQASEPVNFSSEIKGLTGREPMSPETIEEEMK